MNAKLKPPPAIVDRTPGQVAYEAFRRVFDTGTLKWGELKKETKDAWEVLASEVRR